MRRKFRNRGTWLPIIGDDNGAELPADIVWTTVRQVTLDPVPGSVLVDVSSVVFDVPIEPNNQSAFGLSMGSYILNEYTLKRIVGKINVRIDDSGDPDGRSLTVPSSYTAAAGFFIARAGDEISPDGQGAPIGGATSFATDYNPLDPNCIREPWIWRRTWQLGSPYHQFWNNNPTYDGAAPPNPLTFIGSGLPTANSGYGSVFDGPHVDARTRRRVGNDDRLWIAVAAQINPITSSASNPGHVGFTWELRCFGQARRARNSGQF